MITPEQWEERFYLVSHWNTGDPNHPNPKLREKPPFRSAYKNGYNYIGLHKVETTSAGERILFKKNNKGDYCRVVHVLQIFDIVKRLPTAAGLE